MSVCGTYTWEGFCKLDRIPVGSVLEIVHESGMKVVGTFGARPRQPGLEFLFGNFFEVPYERTPFSRYDFGYLNGEILFLRDQMTGKTLSRGLKPTIREIRVIDRATWDKQCAKVEEAFQKICKQAEA